MARLKVVPENLLERVVLALGLAPTPLLDTMVALLLARSVMAATKLGVFEALADGPLTARETAARCATDEDATAKLLSALVGARYVRVVPARHAPAHLARRAEIETPPGIHAEGQAGAAALMEGDMSLASRFALTPVARRWLLSSSAFPLGDAVQHRYLDLALLDHAEEYVRTGVPLDYHQTMDATQWDLYERGQRAHALLSSREVVWRTPLPRDARAMLDVGGGHGLYAAAFCRRRPGLQAVVFDLPEALAHAARLIAAEGLGPRLATRAGDASTDDLGAEEYDLVFIANLVHHFDDAGNRDLMVRAAKALRPGGHVVVADVIHQSSFAGNQVGGLTDFYFAVTSQSGTWSFTAMAAWQEAAGLAPRKPIKLLTVPGYGLQAARKPIRR